MLNPFAVIEKLQAIPTIETFKSSIGGILSLCGFETWAYTVKLPDSYNASTFDVLHCWDQEFIDRYATIHLPHCPRFKHLWFATTPLIYDKKFMAEDLKQLPHHPEPVQAVVKDIIDFGYHGHGFSLSTHGRHGDKGVLTLQNRDQNRSGIEAIDQNLLAAHAFFPFLHMKYIELKGWKPPGVSIPLSQRERECLRWAADGKTAWETGMILNLSERTVNFHLTNAQNKLQAANKIQAVARAVLYNIL